MVCDLFCYDERRYINWIFRRVIETDSVGVNIGIWKACSTQNNQKVCGALTCANNNDTSTACQKILAVRILLTGACIFAVISAICLFLCALTSENINPKLLLSTKILVIICLIMGIIGVILGFNMTGGAPQAVQMKLGVAAYMGIIGIVFNLGGAVAAMLIKE
jgi:hypothetical protein